VRDGFRAGSQVELDVNMLSFLLLRLLYFLLLLGDAACGHHLTCTTTRPPGHRRRQRGAAAPFVKTVAICSLACRLAPVRLISTVNSHAAHSYSANAERYRNCPGGEVSADICHCGASWAIR